MYVYVFVLENTDKMSGSIPPAQVQQLKMFVQACKANPNILHLPELDFLKTWLEDMGATVPPPKEEPKAEASHTI